MSDFPVEAGDGFGGVTITCIDARLSIGSFLNATASSIAPTGWNGANWPAANRAFFVPFVVPHPMTLVKGFWLNATTVSGNVDLAVYDTAGNRLVSAGSTAQAGSAALQVVDITDLPINPGRYYMALAASSATAQFSALSAAAAVMGAAGCLQQSTAFPLPNPATLATMATAYLPAFGLTARVLT